MLEPAPTRFVALYREALGPLRRHLARMLGNRADAQDVAHDAFARVYEVMDTQEVRRPHAFLFTVARRLAISAIRRRRASPLREADGQVIELTASQAPGVEQLAMARQEWRRLEAAIAALPPGCRSVLRLCNDEDLTHAEVGARLGIAVSTVEKQHARALRLLRAALHDDAGTQENSRGDRGCAAGR